MPPKLYGRYGSYSPRTPKEKEKARKLDEKRRQQQAMTNDFLAKHKECKNGCGRPPAWYEGRHSLRHGGCCSEQCESEWWEKQYAKATQGGAQP